MSHLWIRDEAGAWAVLPLVGDSIELTNIPTPEFQRLEGNEAAGRPVLLRSGRDASERWTLVAAAEHRVTINGFPVRTGIQVLRDRDQMDVPGAGSVFFSNERPLHIQPLPAGLGDVFCPRCRQRIEEETPAVRCPQCGLWYHESEEYPCFSYDSTCATCPQPTAFDASFRFCPEDL